MLEPVIQVLEGLPPWQAALLVLGLSLGAAIVTEAIVLEFASRMVRRTESAYDNIIVRELRWPVVITVGLAGVFILTRVPRVVAAMPIAEADINRFFDTPVLTVIILVWAVSLNRLVNRIVEQMKETKTRVDIAPVLSNIWTLLVVVGAGVMILDIWGIEITPLIGAAGIAGIAIGFAAKDTVANFFGGVALYFDHTYKLGDYVTLDSGEAGNVVKTGIRSTTLLTRDEVLITVPNSLLNAGKVINQSAPQRRKRIRVPVSVGYGTDLDAFEDLLLSIAAEDSLVLDHPEPRARFRTFGDSGLNYELLCWVDNPIREARAKHQLNKAIYKRLGEVGIEIPYPKRDVVWYDGNGSGVGPAPTSASAERAPENPVDAATHSQDAKPETEPEPDPATESK